MEKEVKDEILNLFAKILKENLIQVMKSKVGKEITEKEAETLLCNIGLHIMNQNKDIIINKII